MSILKRDARRCRICGRRPDDDVDLELHVHHIRPSGNGGLSEEENLITLCNTCHVGLNPHEDWNLFEYLPDQGGLGRLDIDNKLLLKGISNYQKVVSAIRNKTSLDAVPAEPTVPRPERRKKSSSKPSP